MGKVSVRVATKIDLSFNNSHTPIKEKRIFLERFAREYREPAS